MAGSWSRIGLVALGGQCVVAGLEGVLGGGEPWVVRLLRRGLRRLGGVAVSGIVRPGRSTGQAGLLAGLEHRGDELADLVVGQRALETGHELPADDGEHGRDALHLEGLDDARIGVGVDLGQDDRSPTGFDDRLEAGHELIAGLGPGRGQDEQHRHLERAIEHVSLERSLGGVDRILPGLRRRSLGRTGRGLVARLERGEVDGAGHCRRHGRTGLGGRTTTPWCTGTHLSSFPDQANVAITRTRIPSAGMAIRIEKSSAAVWTIVIDRPEARNALDGPTAEALADAFGQFDADESACVAVLCGAGGTFCAGADLKQTSNPLDADMSTTAPMGPSRLTLGKPVIAAISGYAVAGGIELASWCDLRVMESDAVVGVFCRRWGVPLIDGGTVRLPRIIGLGRALDLILTGRAVAADEALAMGFANRVVAPGQARAAAEALAAQIAAFLQASVRSDRRSVYDGFGHDELTALGIEFSHGLESLRREGLDGAARFSAGAGRHGSSES